MEKPNSEETAGAGSVVSDDLFGVWIPCDDHLPELTDDGVLVYFAETRSIETVHRQDYFADITNGVDEAGKQKYTKWYRSQNVTHWMALPDPPNAEPTGSRSGEANGSTESPSGNLEPKP